MANSNMDLKDTECPVCKEYYKEPKILPCAHLVCRTCLVKWMTANTNRQCPVCRHAIVNPQNREEKSCDDIANELPTDDVMSEMVDNIRISEQKRVCHVHKTVNAKSFCLHCRLMLCSSCVDVHVAVPVTSFHKFENLDKLTLVHLTSNRHCTCSAHPDKESERFCSTHKIFICQKCASSNHCACPEVPTISQMLDRNTRSLSEMESRLIDMELGLGLTQAYLEDYLIQLEHDAKASFSEIDSACDRLIVSVARCRNRLKKRVQDNTDNAKKDACKQKDELSHKRGNITSHCSLIQRMQLSASWFSLVTMVPQLNKRVSDLDQRTKLSLDGTNLTTAKMTIDGNALSRIEMEMARMGELKIGTTLVENQGNWTFHRSHGKNVVLTNNNMTAENIHFRFGLVYSSDPMKVNMLYEVRVDETHAGHNGKYEGFGIVNEDPNSITDLPWFSGVPRSPILVIGDDLYVKTESTPHNVNIDYEAFKVGSRIGVLVDAARSLHIYVDGKDQGIAYRGVQMPCWALFNMRTFLRKVTVLPLTRVP